MALSAAGKRLKESPLHIYDTVGDIADICKEASAACSKFGTKLVVIDYLQLIQMRSCQEGYFTKVGMVSNALKHLAMELKVAVVALAQLSRDVEKDKRSPVLSDLRDSGQIEQDADVIGFLYADKESQAGEVKLLVAKNRTGPVGQVELEFNKWITRFDPATQ